MIPEPEQETITKYMDVKSLCHTDSAMTRVEEIRLLRYTLNSEKAVEPSSSL